MELPFVRRYRQLLQEIEKISPLTRLVVVTKYHSPKEILPLYDAGCRDFGESRVQEWALKKEELPQDIAWHWIGSLQKNKVRKVVGHVAMIHSVDSLSLAEKINEVSQEKGIATPVLLQVNTSGEEVKHGFSSEECDKLFPLIDQFPGILIKGFMTMAPFTEEKKVIIATFRRLRECRDLLNRRYRKEMPLKELSMGMSHDYQLALQEGATMVRIGSSIFASDDL